MFFFSSRNRVWGCRDCTVPSVGNTPGQSAWTEGGFLSPESAEFDEPAGNSLGFWNRHIFPGWNNVALNRLVGQFYRFGFRFGYLFIIIIIMHCVEFCFSGFSSNSSFHLCALCIIYFRSASISQFLGHNNRAVSNPATTSTHSSDVFEFVS